MRRYLSPVVTVVCCLSLLNYLISCNDDDGPSAEQIRLQEHSATWALGSVTNDGNDVTSQFTGFSLSIDQFSFTTENGGNAWPTSGTYSFIENDLDRLQRSDGVEITIDAINNDDLSLSFQVSTLPGGRTAGITGNFIFSLVTQ